MIKFLSSAKITVACLLLLFILTFWGTIAQVQQGLYVAQERYFNSFFFLAAGFIPFPGAQLVLWVFFINLMCMLSLTWKKYVNWNNAGLLIIHFGLIIYFLAAFMIFHLAQESNVHLAEGQGTNVSASYQDWELAYWTDQGRQRQVTAFDTKSFMNGFQIPFDSRDFSLTVHDFYLNSDAFNNLTAKTISPALNVSGITYLRAKPVDKQKEQNVQGGVFDLKFDNKHHSLILYGADGEPTTVNITGKKYSFILRHKRYPLPFTITLDHFKAEFHPGTEVAKSFQSNVTITTDGFSRPVRIYMNNPLRYKDYTIYQASYDTDGMGHQYSTLAVVKNSARILPYIACFVVFFGLALHFLMQALRAKICI